MRVKSLRIKKLDVPGRKKVKRIIKIPIEYLEGIEIGNSMFPALYQFENGLRLAIFDFLTTCYGEKWWDEKLATKLPNVHKYAEDQRVKKDNMPWIGNSSRVNVLPIHMVTLGQLEEIVKAFSSECIPELFPTKEFFLGHMEVIKRVRNYYTHMFPCMTEDDASTAKREIKTLVLHINSKLKY